MTEINDDGSPNTGEVEYATVGSVYNNDPNYIGINLSTTTGIERGWIFRSRFGQHQLYYEEDTAAAGGQIGIQAWNGSSWSTLQTLDIDIDNYVGSNGVFSGEIDIPNPDTISKVRFYVTGTAAGDVIYIDNVQISGGTTTMDTGGNTAFSSTSASSSITVNMLADVPTDLTTAITTEGGLNLNNDGGNDAYLQSDSSPFSGQSEVTIEVQFSIDTPATDMTTLLSYATGTNQDELFLGIDSTGEIFFRTSANGSAGYGSITKAPQLFDGEQHSVAVTWENTGGILMFYVDGEKLGLGRNDYQKTSTIDAGGDLVFGQHQGVGGGSFDADDTFEGTMYDVRLFNDVRTDAEIAASYDATIPYNESGLVANWVFDNYSSDGIVTDRVSGNNLTVQHVGGFTASSPSLTLELDENSLTGRIVGSINGEDAQREARIAALLAADANPDLQRDDG